MMMFGKFVVVSCLLASLPIGLSAQFKRVVVEEVQNHGMVKGKTFRVYLEMTSKNDQIMMIYGDRENPLSISATRPFFQALTGGALSRDVNRNLTATTDSLKYDSWLTIGAEDNYENNLSQLNLNLTGFEREGNAVETNDGAWFCVPTDKQTRCKEDKRILIMQLTTEGEISGLINIMGRTASGANFQEKGIRFSSVKPKK